MPLRVYMAGALSDRAAPHVDSNRGEALVRNHNYAGLKGRLVAVAEMPQVYDKNSARRPERFCGRGGTWNAGDSHDDSLSGSGCRISSAHFPVSNISASLGPQMTKWLSLGSRCAACIRLAS